MLVFILFFTLWSSSVVVSPKFFYLISPSPRMFHLYLSISCVSSWSFLAALSVLVFQVPRVMLSLSRIFDDAPVAHLTPPPWCTAKGAVLVDPGGDRSGMEWLCVVIAWWVLSKYNLREPIPLQVDHVAVEFIVEPFRPSGPCLRTVKVYAKWCRLDTSYFTHNWETRGGRERLPSRIDPKDRPTPKTSLQPKGCLRQQIGLLFQSRTVQWRLSNLRRPNTNPSSEET